MSETKPKFMKNQILAQSYFEKPNPYVNAPSCHVNLLELSRYAKRCGKKLTELTEDEVKQFSLLIHPGETLADVLKERGITQAELAMKTNFPLTYISSVINGKTDISVEFAMALENTLGVKKVFWLNLQANYNAEL